MAWCVRHPDREAQCMGVRAMSRVKGTGPYGSNGGDSEGGDVGDGEGGDVEGAGIATTEGAGPHGIYGTLSGSCDIISERMLPVHAAIRPG